MGWPHPDQLLENLTEEQFFDWQAKYQLDPWGEQRADLRNAATFLLTASLSVKTECSPSLFYPYFQDEEQEIEDVLAYEAAARKHIEKYGLN